YVIDGQPRTITDQRAGSVRSASALMENLAGRSVWRALPASVETSDDEIDVNARFWQAKPMPAASRTKPWHSPALGRTPSPGSDDGASNRHHTDLFLWRTL